MPDPAELPLELFNTILNFALPKSNPQYLSSLSLLNHRWHGALLGRIYNEWKYNGFRQSFMVLFQFLRTICHNPRIAMLVRTLNVGNWGAFPRGLTPFELPADESEWLRRAIHGLGLGKLEDRILRSLSQQDRRPLMAMLLALVPNLSILYACVPRFDPILGFMLERTLRGESSSPLWGLKELYLFAEYPIYLGNEGNSESQTPESSPDNAQSDLPWFKLDYLWPVFYLPNLRTLLLYNLDPRGAAEYLGQYDGESAVENLYLIGYGTKEVFTIQDFEAFISRTRMLKTFSMYNPEFCDHPELSHSHLWDYLRKHEDTLQALDIYQLHPMSKMGHCGRFGGFTGLEDLRIPIDMLLGGCIGSPLAPFRLRETLPRTIQNLTLYGEQGYLALPDYPDQLQELLGGGFPSLRSITLEKFDSIARENGKLKEPYRKLRELCSDKGIILRIEESDQLSRGNQREELWKKAIYVQDDEGESDGNEDEADYSDSEDEYGPYLDGTLEYFNVTFTDHHGGAARMVFENRESIPLPPLYSFAIYFTHPNVSPENTDLVGFFQEIQGCHMDSFDVRFDMYFLPSATHRDCVQHYQAEKATRGIYQDQVRMFNRTPRYQVYPLPGRPNKIPGMVKKYKYADQMLFICSDEDWREGQQALTVLKFGASSHTMNMAFRVIEDCPMTPESRSYDSGAHNQLIVENEMFFSSHYDRDIFLDPWQKATSRGWKGW